MVYTGTNALSGSGRQRPPARATRDSPASSAARRSAIQASPLELTATGNDPDALRRGRCKEVTCLYARAEQSGNILSAIGYDARALRVSDWQEQEVNDVPCAMLISVERLAHAMPRIAPSCRP
jgi:hypothetical protein